MSKKTISNSLSLIAGSSMFVLFGLIVSKLLNYAYRVIIARAYGPEEYGLFTLAATVVSFATAIAMFGMSDSIIRFFSIYTGKNRINEARYTFWFIRNFTLVISIIIGFMVFLTSDLISNLILGDNSLTNYLQLFSIVIVIAVASRPYLGVLRAIGEIKIFTFSSHVLQNAVKVILLLILIYLGFTTDSIVFSYLLGTLVLLIVSIYYVKLKVKQLNEKYKLGENNKKDIREKIISHSWPLLFFGIANLSLYWIDSIFLGHMKGAEIVGIYNAAVPIALLVMAVPEIFVQLLVPLLSKHYANNNLLAMGQISKQITKWIILLAFPVTLIFAYMPEIPLRILFGQEYLSASLPLVFLSVGSFILAVSFVSQHILSTFGKTKLLLYSIIFVAFLNSLLNYLLIPLNQILFLPNEGGMVGAAIATFISYSFLAGILFYKSKQQLGIFVLRRKSIGLIIGAFISIIITIKLYDLFNFEVNSLLSYVIFMIIYGLFYLFVSIKLFNSLDKYDLEILNNLLAKIGINKK